MSHYSHTRQKTESFGGSQMDFEFPTSSLSDLRSTKGARSDVSSDINTFNYLTRVSISSSEGNSLNTSELFMQLQNAGYQSVMRSEPTSDFSKSSFSVSLKQEELPRTLSFRSTARSTTRSKQGTISRSSSVLRFKASPSIRHTMYQTSPVRTLSTQSTLKRSNAVKYKEGWLKRLLNKAMRFKARFQNWRRIVKKRVVFKRRKTEKNSKVLTPPVSASIRRSPSVPVRDEKVQETIENLTEERTQFPNIVSGYLQDQQLLDLKNMSQELLLNLESSNDYLTTIPVEQVTSYPTPNVDTSYSEAQTVHDLWSHYLKKTVLNRIQLKLDISEYKDNRNTRPESALDFIISDYQTEDVSSDEDNLATDGFDSDTNNGHYSSLTSISSYSDQESYSDMNSIVESEYQSSYYPTRENSMLRPNLSIKRQNSFLVNRKLSTASKFSEASNMTYIEDLVNIKMQSSCKTSPAEKYTAEQNPYSSRPRNALTRSPSFVIPKRSNTLLMVKEE